MAASRSGTTMPICMVSVKTGSGMVLLRRLAAQDDPLDPGQVFLDARPGEAVGGEPVGEPAGLSLADLEDRRAARLERARCGTGQAGQELPSVRLGVDRDVGLVGQLVVDLVALGHV